MLVWNLETQSYVELRAWMRYCHYILTPRDWAQQEWDNLHQTTKVR